MKTPITRRSFLKRTSTLTAVWPLGTSPDHWRTPAAILACAPGKHVYVGKPGSLNGEESEWILLIPIGIKFARVFASSQKQDPAAASPPAQAALPTNQTSVATKP